MMIGTNSLVSFLGWYIVSVLGIILVALGGMAFESENDSWAAALFAAGTILISVWGYVLAT